MFDEAFTSQYNGGYDAWYKRLRLRISPAVVQISSKAGSSTTLGVTAALSSLRMIHSSLRLETNHQLMM